MPDFQNTSPNPNMDYGLPLGGLPSKPWANTTPQQAPTYLDNAPKPPPLQHDISQVAFVTATEGGTWVPWDAWKALPVPNHNGKRIHSIMFADGYVWDALNGGRGGSMDYSPSDMQNMRTRWADYEKAKELLAEMRQQPEVFGDIP